MPHVNTPGEYSVYWWDCDGGQHTELRFISDEDAVRAAQRLALGPASAILGIVSRVIITDGGDCLNFEWIKGKGVTFK